MEHDPGADSRMSNQNGTQAIDRAARLLSEVVRSADPMTFTGLSAATGLAKSTTSRLLLALERNGLVRRDDNGRFLPGEMFVSFAWRGGAEVGLVAVAQPFLQRLGKATGETVNLGVAGKGRVEQIAQVDSTYMIGGTNWVGMSLPLHCSRSEEHTSELQSHVNLVCRLLLEKKKRIRTLLSFEILTKKITTIH